MSKILVIEDEQMLLENLSFHLALEDFEVLTALNGAEGVRIAFSEKPDLIICDINMPEMDGYQVIKEIRNNPLTRSTPFIFLTARTDKSDYRYGMELGADDFITKPYTDKEILSAVKARIKKHEDIKEVFDNRIEKLRQNIASTLPHELKTPLSAILAYSEILSKSFKSLDEGDIISMLDSINSSGKRLLHLFNNYIFFTGLFDLKVDNEELKYLSVEYPEQEISKIFKEVSAHHNKTIYSDIKVENKRIEIHYNHFYKILEELIDNAVKFSDSSQTITIKGISDKAHYIISIKNSGTAFSQENIEAIGGFMQFDRKILEQQGIGLGLAIVKKLIDFYKGKLEIIPDESSTEVQIFIPLKYLN